MTPYKTVLTLSTLTMSLGVSSAAHASSDLALTFELSPSPSELAAAAAAAEAATAAPAPVELVAVPLSAEAPLPIPPGAENPPMASDNVRPAGVYGGLDAMAIGSVPSVKSLLPAPPPIPDYLQPVVNAIAPAPIAETEVPAVAEQPVETSFREDIQLFVGIREKPAAPEAPIAAANPAEPEPATFAYSFDNFAELFSGGTESLVARAVGSAEGTRTPEGHKNPAYFGHVDPGNGVWNLGTFSYQHGASSPEEADDKQLQRLRTQTEKLRQIALDNDLQLSQEELLNGIDLANQAPLAALDRGGYVDWLKEAHALGMEGSEAIIWARTRSFIDPDTQLWNAPGLGNNVYSISHDQERRANAIARAVAAYNAQSQIAIAPAPTPPLVADSATADVASSTVETPQNVELDDVKLKLDNFSTATVAEDENSVATVAGQDGPADEAIPSSKSGSETVAMASPRWGGLFLRPQRADLADPTSSRRQTIDKQPGGRLTQALVKLLNLDAESATTVDLEVSPTPTVNTADQAVTPQTATESASSPVTSPAIAIDTAGAELEDKMTDGQPAPSAAELPAASPQISGTASAPEQTYKPHEAFAVPRVLAPNADDAEPLDDDLLSAIEGASTVEETSDAAVAGAALTRQPQESAIANPQFSDSDSSATLDSNTAGGAIAPLTLSASEISLEATTTIGEPSDNPQSTDHTKALADRTDSETLRQQTLESLDQLQLMLKSETAK